MRYYSHIEEMEVVRRKLLEVISKFWAQDFEKVARIVKSICDETFSYDDFPVAH